ncbi:MAG: hypothetical protein AB7O56_16155 [Bauldia sp.]
MSATTSITDGWSWWQARRLRYNVALATSGLAAYVLAILISVAFGDAVFATLGEAAGQTLFLGSLFLVVMGIANVCYLLGPFGEAWLRPRDVERYRETAFAMGFWGSAALPFLVPLVNLASQLS